MDELNVRRKYKYVSSRPPIRDINPLRVAIAMSLSKILVDSTRRKQSRYVKDNADNLYSRHQEFKTWTKSPVDSNRKYFSLLVLDEKKKCWSSSHKMDSLDFHWNLIDWVCGAGCNGKKNGRNNFKCKSCGSPRVLAEKLIMNHNLK